MRHLHKAFTMIELVMIIIVVGILTAVAIPKFSTNELSDATHQVIRHLRYTQHLAMTDETYDSTDEVWHQRFWSIRFSRQTALNSVQGWVYTIFRDKTEPTPDSKPNTPADEVAIDPMTKLYLSGGYSDKITYATSERNPKMALSDEYGFENANDAMNFDVCGQVIAFDNLGRPYTQLMGEGNTAAHTYQKLVTNRCTITLTRGGQSSRICIEPYTGYIYDCTP